MDPSPPLTVAPPSTPALVRLLLLGAGLGILSCHSDGTLAVGAPCTLHAACATQACIAEKRDPSGVQWLGGYCSGNCQGAPCPEGICLTLEDGGAYCVASCAGEGDCRPGYVCALDVGACLPDCRLGWPCGAVLGCDVDSGRCLGPDPADAGIDQSPGQDAAAPQDGRMGSDAGAGGFGPGGPGGRM